MWRPDRSTIVNDLWYAIRALRKSPGFALAVSLATTVAFGLLPALRCSKINLVEGLTGAAAGLNGRRGRGVQASLVVAETALALVLAAAPG
jgi:hypothetical protein